MRRLVAFIACTAFLLAAVLPARAATQYQDLWWVGPSEDGWGIQLVQQGDVLFATWFVYGSTGQPTWFVMPNAPRSGAGGNVFTGLVYTTTGTHFALPQYNPASFAVTQAGSATFTFSDARTASLVYTVNGAMVTKQITRQQLSALNLAGLYYGGISKSATGCLVPGNNGSRVDTGTFTVTHTTAGGSVGINVVGICNFTGTVQQFGSLFEGSGNYTCAADGTTGTWTGREGQLADLTFAMKLTLRPNGDTCVVTSAVGGFRSP